MTEANEGLVEAGFVEEMNVLFVASGIDEASGPCLEGAQAPM
jgi:hypothetical protein